MKRKLAPEALYTSKLDLDRKRRRKDAYWDEAAERIRRFDPDGERALALLKEFERPK
jgi:hypothetical protein